MSAACSNCGEPHGPDDVFCENCGFDFLTGSLPAAEAPVTSTAPATASATIVLRVSADREYHERMDADGVLDFPDPAPARRDLPVAGATALIGRARPSRGLFPDVDLSSDPAVSSRHAVLARRDDGTWTLTDVGSTNGTYVGDSTVALEADVAVSVAVGTTIQLGAWTRIEILDAEEIVFTTTLS
ncbi:MAG: FHA domain-containing protein [Actinomycetota bacterium]